MTELPDHVGVYGGGRMGAGIAHAFVSAGATVTVIESGAPAAVAARERVVRSLRRAEERTSLPSGADALAENLIVTTEPPALADCGLVIEAVPEDFDLKLQVLTSVEQVARTAILATNTSSLSINGLAAGLARPHRFIGLHFFNPVPSSDLVEIVVGSQTAPDIVSVAQRLVARLKKTPITVNNSPGFASSRLGVTIALEAMRMVEEGVASCDDIDAAMVLGYRHPIGPLKTTDVVGLDVRLGIADYLAQTLGPRFEPPQILRDIVSDGELGRKAGKGFYEW